MKARRGGRLIATLLSMGAVLGCASQGTVKLEGALDYLPGGERVLVRGDDAITLYDVGTRRVLWERPLAHGTARSATFSRSGSRAVLFELKPESETENGWVSVLALDSGQSIGESFMALGSVATGLSQGQVAISDDGRWLASGLDYASFRILEGEGRQSVFQLEAFRAASIEFSPSQSPLRVSAVSYNQGRPSVGVFEYAGAWKNIAILPGGGARWVGARLVIVQGATLDVWDGTTRNRLATLAREDSPPGTVKPLDHARSLVGVAEGGRLRVIDVSTQKIVFDRNTFENVYDFELRGDRVIVSFEAKDRSGHLHQYSLLDGALLRSDELGPLTRFRRGVFYVPDSHDRDEVLMAPRLLPGGRYLDKVRNETEHTITEIAR